MAVSSVDQQTPLKCLVTLLSHHGLGHLLIALPRPPHCYIFALAKPSVSWQELMPLLAELFPMVLKLSSARCHPTPAFLDAGPGNVLSCFPLN